PSLKRSSSMSVLKKTALSSAVMAALCVSPATVAQEPPAAQQQPGGGQAATAGGILGRVLDPATGGYLRNARIRIDGRPATISGERGEFRISDLAAGTYRVAVEYTGFSPVERTVEVRAGETAEPVFELFSSIGAAQDATELDAVQVVGAREGDARAIMEQRASMNITNTLSAESFGEIGDA